jgi:hypothetical protein
VDPLPDYRVKSCSELLLFLRMPQLQVSPSCQSLLPAGAEQLQRVICWHQFACRELPADCKLAILHLAATPCDDVHMPPRWAYRASALRLSPISIRVC